MIRSVRLSSRAKKELRSIPSFIVRKFQKWVDDIEESGLEEVRKRPGWHDEPLAGKRAGQRSVRLNIAYRVIYEIHGDSIEFVEVQEVSKHDY